LVLGKFLTVFTIYVATVVLGLSSMCVTFEWARRALAHGLSRQVVSSVAAINFTGLAAVFLMLLPVAAMLSAFMLMVGLFSKSFREAQSYAGPLMIVVIAPIVPAMLPGTELNARLRRDVDRDLALELYPAHFWLDLRLRGHCAGGNGVDVPSRRSDFSVVKCLTE
jgi:hypothetical protein